MRDLDDVRFKYAHDPIAWMASLLAIVASGLPLPPRTATAQQADSTLQVTVGNIRTAAGHIRVAVCTRESFLKADCPFHGTAPARAGSVVVTVHGVPPGAYAVQAFQDEDDSGRIKRSLLGIPKEGFGFSRDAPANFGSPSFANAAFQVAPGVAEVALRLRYVD